MKTVTLDVRSPSETMGDFTHAWKSGKAQKSARISFATPELLWRVLTAKRWELLKALCGAGPVSIREAARRVSRDVKAVHGDVTALLDMPDVQWYQPTERGLEAKLREKLDALREQDRTARER